MKKLLELVFGKLDGKKTMLGLVIFVFGRFVTLYDPTTGETISDIGLTLTGFGALHKLWKGTP